MIAKNIAHAAILAGHTALFRTVADLLADLDGDSPGLRRRKFRFYARPTLLVHRRSGYLAYDAHAADLLFEIVNHRYERNSVFLTTNKAFKEWNTVFPNATCIAALLDRLTHHADVTLLEGDSYRMRESQLEAAARKKPQRKGKPMPTDLETYRQTLLISISACPTRPAVSAASTCAWPSNFGSARSR